MRFKSALAGAMTLVLVALTSVFAAGTAAASTVPNPALQGPIEGGVHGYPWNHSLFPLSGTGAHQGVTKCDGVHPRKR
jgi:opacity protein-like surface antigen